MCALATLPSVFAFTQCLFRELGKKLVANSFWYLDQSFELSTLSVPCIQKQRNSLAVVLVQ